MSKRGLPEFVCSHSNKDCIKMYKKRNLKTWADYDHNAYIRKYDYEMCIIVWAVYKGERKNTFEQQALIQKPKYGSIFRIFLLKSVTAFVGGVVLNYKQHYFDMSIHYPYSLVFKRDRDVNEMGFWTRFDYFWSSKFCTVFGFLINICIHAFSHRNKTHLVCVCVYCFNDVK